MPHVLARATRFAADLLFPPRCALCGCEGTLLCDACVEELPSATGNRCERCWTPLEVASICRYCADVSPAFISLRAAFIMEAGARQLVHELKYNGLTSLGAPMGQLMHERIQIPPVDLIVPVPLHPTRRRMRGYNQAELLARELSRGARLPLDTAAARRIRATMPLAKTMHRDERQAIVRGAFAARPDAVAGRAILLVDDVATTGATLDACGEALLEAGADSVRCITWARAD